jgi:hypothetical protein
VLFSPLVVEEGFFLDRFPCRLQVDLFTRGETRRGFKGVEGDTGVSFACSAIKEIASSSARRFLSPRPRSRSARESRRILSISSFRRGLRTSTLQRERRGAMTSKEGFSVVAPMMVRRPFSTYGEKGVLLGLVETVDLVHKQNGFAPA